ncbi:DNA primase regulatory subunit PriL [Cuniculiplasma sp. SKW3]|uniref:DNA primase regulatory subunit PriL n=1 Tax=unclassified Cuniculiplasma TaxID=2619706 RepID=UPI003FD4A098
MEVLGPMEDKVREVTQGFSDMFGETSEIIDQIIQFLKKILDKGAYPKSNLFDLTRNEWKINTALTLWILRVIDVDSFTSRAIYNIRDSMEESLSKTSAEELSIVAERLGIPMEYSSSGNYYISRVPIFTKSCSRISGSNFRLVYQSFKDNGVLSNKNKIDKIIREYAVLLMKDTIEEIDREIAVKYFDYYLHDLEAIRENAKKLLTPVDLGDVDISAFPPCILHFISDAKNGVNIPHMGRFAMVSFLSKVGMPEEDIMKIFSSVPDFSRKITEYQVKHILGEISGIKYIPPKCETLRSNHLCYMDDDPICNSPKMKHPLSYYRIKKQNSKKSA